VTTLSLADWLNFSLALIEAEKMFIGLGPEPNPIKVFSASIEATLKFQPIDWLKLVA